MSTEPDNTVAKPNAVRINGWTRAAIWPLSLIVRLWSATLRFEISPESLKTIEKKDEPVAFVTWHNRLFLTHEIVRRYRQGRPFHTLISASKDGAWLAAFFDFIGIKSVRGSNNANARESVGLLVNVMRSGSDIGITPDGPRGPRYEIKGGAVIIVRRAKATMLLFGAQFEHAWQLRSWDRFYLPRPFSRVRLHCRAVTAAELSAPEMTLETLSRILRDMNPDAKPDARGNTPPTI